MSEIVEEIVGALNSIITDILREKRIFQVKDVKTISNASFISSEKNANHVDASKQKTDGSGKTIVVTDAIPVDTIINVAPNEIIETQETYTVGEDGKIEIQGEPSKEKKYSL